MESTAAAASVAHGDAAGRFGERGGLLKARVKNRTIKSLISSSCPRLAPENRPVESLYFDAKSITIKIRSLLNFKEHKNDTIDIRLKQ
jgi:hypothetical protein